MGREEGAERTQIRARTVVEKLHGVGALRIVLRARGERFSPGGEMFDPTDRLQEFFCLLVGVPTF